MGKNRKAKQVVNQAETQSNGDGHRDEVPIDFLTSDDFQVVKKRHHSKKLDENCLTRSRSISERFADEDEDIFGCHAGFWTARSQSSEDTAALIEDNCPKVRASNKKAGLAKLLSAEDLTLSLRNNKDSLNGTQSDDNVSDSNDQLETGNETLLTNGKDSCASLSVEEHGGKTEASLTGLKSGDCGDVPALGKTNGVSSLDQKLDDISCKVSQLEIKETIVSSSVEHVGDENEKSQFNAKGDGKCVEESSKTKKKDKKSKSKKSSEKTESKTNSESNAANPKTLVTDISETACLEKGLENEAEKHSEDSSGKRDRKRPSKKQLEAIHEALRKAKEEEEKLRQEEEAKRKLAEEAQRLAQEKLRLEQEKKEKKKLKEKQKREKLRSEGKLLSKSQKQARARMEATLEVLRQQGIDVPQIGEKRLRRPRLDSYNKNTHRKRLDSTQSDTSQADKSGRHKTESLSSQESSKDSLSDLPSSFDSKDSWDLNAIVGSVLTAESDGVGSEESDDEHSSSTAAQSAKEAVGAKLKESLSKSPLAKLPTADVKVVEKKDSVKLRSPVVCVLGHVDTGKTKLLDYIRKTHVQDSEAGGITQQIGATMIPQEALKEKCKMVKDFSSFELKVPGLLVIDTPGHESFSNLRSRGSSICDIAILVVDIMHGLEPQTLESINLLKVGKIPFVVALNKIDRLYGWKSAKDDDIEKTISSQSQSTQSEFKRRCQEVILQLANECLNAALYYENPDPRTYVSMVPTSAITGDGMGNLLSLITQLTQSLMHKKLVFTQELQATVLEVKVIAGLGTTIDVILVNGRLQEGDTIVLAGHEGPIVTQIRSLLMPQPLKELRVKNPYIEYKAVEGAQGVKVTGKDFDKSVAGLPLFVAPNHSKVEGLKSEMSLLLEQTISCIKTSERGVYVQSSTLGSLEALLEFLTSVGIPYFGVKVGPVVKKDVMKASIMLEHDAQYATIMAFDVKVERDAQDLADSLGVKIIHANIIYHLRDAFLKHREVVMKKREETMHLAVFPCILRLLSAHDTALLGSPMEFDVTVEAGTLKPGTPLCVPTRGNLELGTVESVLVGCSSATCAKEGQDVRIVVDGDPTVLSKVSQLDPEDYFISRVTKQSIDICKEYYRDELGPSDWNLMGELRKMLHTHV